MRANTAGHAVRLAALATLILAGAGCDGGAGVNVGPRSPKIKVLADTPGAGVAAREGKTVTAHYIGRLPDGAAFLDTRANGGPESWQIGAGTVIAGMDEAVLGMRAGGRRTVEIPPELHWGRAGHGGVIPEHAALTFEIELITVR